MLARLRLTFIERWERTLERREDELLFLPRLPPLFLEEENDDSSSSCSTNVCGTPTRRVSGSSSAALASLIIMDLYVYIVQYKYVYILYFRCLVLSLCSGYS